MTSFFNCNRILSHIFVNVNKNNYYFLKLFIGNYLLFSKKSKTKQSVCPKAHRPQIYISFYEYLLLFFAEHIETEKSGFVIGVLALKMCIHYLSAFNEFCKTYELAELALEIKAVALVRYQKYITLTGVHY